MVEEKVKALREVAAGGAIEDVKTKTEELSTSLSKIGSSMYSQPGAQGESGAQGQTGATDSAAGVDDKKVADWFHAARNLKVSDRICK